MNALYDLTPMTGKEAAATRTVVIGTFEMNYRVFIIAVASLPAGMILAGLVWPLLGSAGLLMIPIAAVGGVFLFHQRSRRGMQLRHYQALWDKQKAPINKFYMCGVEVDLDAIDLFHVVSSSVDYESGTRTIEGTRDVLADVFDGQGGRVKVAAKQADIGVAETVSPKQLAKAQKLAEKGAAKKPGKNAAKKSDSALDRYAAGPDAAAVASLTETPWGEEIAPIDASPAFPDVPVAAVSAAPAPVAIAPVSVPGESPAPVLADPILVAQPAAQPVAIGTDPYADPYADLDFVAADVFDENGS